MVFESRQTACPRIETLQNALQYVLERSGTLLIVASECFKHFKNRTLQDPLLLECFIIHLNTSNRSIRRLTAIKVRKHIQQCSFSPAERFKYLVLLREMSTNLIYTEQLKYPEAKQFALTYLTIQTLSHKQKNTSFKIQFTICKTMVSRARIMDTQLNNPAHPTERTAQSAPAGPPLPVRLRPQRQKAQL